VFILEEYIFILYRYPRRHRELVNAAAERALQVPGKCDLSFDLTCVYIRVLENGSQAEAGSAYTGRLGTLTTTYTNIYTYM